MDLASAFLFGHPVHSERKQQHIHRLKLLCVSEELGFVYHSFLFLITGLSPSLCE